MQSASASRHGCTTLPTGKRSALVRSFSSRAAAAERASACVAASAATATRRTSASVAERARGIPPTELSPRAARCNCRKHRDPLSGATLAAQAVAQRREDKTTTRPTKERRRRNSVCSRSRSHSSARCDALAEVAAAAVACRGALARPRTQRRLPSQLKTAAQSLSILVISEFASSVHFEPRV